MHYLGDGCGGGWYLVHGSDNFFSVATLNKQQEWNAESASCPDVFAQLTTVDEIGQCACNPYEWCGDSSEHDVCFKVALTGILPSFLAPGSTVECEITNPLLHEVWRQGFDDRLRPGLALVVEGWLVIDGRHSFFEPKIEIHPIRQLQFHADDGCDYWCLFMDSSNRFHQHDPTEGAYVEGRALQPWSAMKPVTGVNPTPGSILEYRCQVLASHCQLASGRDPFSAQAQLAAQVEGVQGAYLLVQSATQLHHAAVLATAGAPAGALVGGQRQFSFPVRAEVLAPLPHDVLTFLQWRLSADPDVQVGPLSFPEAPSRRVVETRLTVPESRLATIWPNVEIEVGTDSVPVTGAPSGLPALGTAIPVTPEVRAWAFGKAECWLEWPTVSIVGADCTDSGLIIHVPFTDGTCFVGNYRRMRAEVQNLPTPPRTITWQVSSSRGTPVGFTGVDVPGSPPGATITFDQKPEPDEYFTATVSIETGTGFVMSASLNSGCTGGNCSLIKPFYHLGVIKGFVLPVPVLEALTLARRPGDPLDAPWLRLTTGSQATPNEAAPAMARCAAISTGAKDALLAMRDGNPAALRAAMDSIADAFDHLAQSMRSATLAADQAAVVGEYLSAMSWTDARRPAHERLAALGDVFRQLAEQGPQHPEDTEPARLPEEILDQVDLNAPTATISARPTRADRGGADTAQSGAAWGVYLTPTDRVGIGDPFGRAGQEASDNEGWAPIECRATSPFFTSHGRLWSALTARSEHVQVTGTPVYNRSRGDGTKNEIHPFHEMRCLTAGRELRLCLPAPDNSGHPQERVSRLAWEEPGAGTLATTDTLVAVHVPLVTSQARTSIVLDATGPQLPTGFSTAEGYALHILDVARLSAFRIGIREYDLTEDDQTESYSRSMLLDCRLDRQALTDALAAMNAEAAGEWTFAWYHGQDQVQPDSSTDDGRHVTLRVKERVPAGDGGASAGPTTTTVDVMGWCVVTPTNPTPAAAGLPAPATSEPSTALLWSRQGVDLEAPATHVSADATGRSPGEFATRFRHQEHGLPAGCRGQWELASEGPGVTGETQPDGSVKVQLPPDGCDVKVTYQVAHPSGLQTSGECWAYAVTVDGQTIRDPAMGAFFELCQVLDALLPPARHERPLTAQIPRLYKSIMRSREARLGPAFTDIGQALARHATALGNLDRSLQDRVGDVLSRLQTQAGAGALIALSRTGVRGQLLGVVEHLDPAQPSGALAVLADGLTECGSTLEASGILLTGSRVVLDG